MRNEVVLDPQSGALALQERFDVGTRRLRLFGVELERRMMRAAEIEPHSSTAKFMMISLPFACSAGGMGTLVGGGRNMVAAAFLKEFTGIEITFFDWIKYAMPAALITVPAAVGVVYLMFRPDPKYKLPQFDEAIGAWSLLEKRCLVIIGLTFLLWLTKGFHGIDYSVTGMLGFLFLFLTNWVVKEFL